MSSASKQSAIGLFRSHDNDMGLADKVDVVELLVTPSSRSAMVKTPVSTAQKSSCARDLGESMMVRAERRAAEKNLGTTSTTPISSPKLLVLPDYPDSHFLEVALDSGVLLGSSTDPSSVLYIIHANELVQTSLAKACILATPSPLTDDIMNVVPPSPSSIPVSKAGVALGSSTSLGDW